MRSQEYNDRIADASKYAKPIEDYPDEWDRALLNVYRADITPTGQEGLRGRALLSAAKEGEAEGQSEVKLLVATGDVGLIVQPKASERVADWGRSDSSGSRRRARCRTSGRRRSPRCCWILWGCSCSVFYDLLTLT